MKRILPYLSIALLVFLFFWQFFIKGLLPIPADTIIGLYHPFRDLYTKDYPNGIPFKNFLITDPVRQQYPWRELVISLEKKLQLPLWNPYAFSGTPLLANFQSAPFYLFNILFFIMPFVVAWSLMVVLGPLLAGIFLFLYLGNLKISKWASILGAFAFSFSGFFISWLEWGTITHVALWLPLILLSIDKIFAYLTTKKISNIKYQISNIHIKNKKFLLWSFVFIFSLVSSFLAGHLQIFFYLFIFSWVYFLARWFQYHRIFNILIAFLIFNFLFLILTSIQWIPTLQFISLSSRNVDVLDFNNPGWFIPWQNLVQFIAPDFFGNPTTLNYWGVWNYAEFVGYVGILPFILAVFSLFFRQDKKTLFFGAGFFISLIFSLPTFFAKIPFVLGIPLIETSQPTRLLFITTFSLAVLAGLGLDNFVKTRNRKIFYPVISFACIFIFLWFLTNFSDPNLAVSRRNLFLPGALLIVSGALLFVSVVFRLGPVAIMIHIIIVGVVVFDLFRFGWKFIPFTNKNYLFPSTRAISFLQRNIGEFRMMSTDARILPPNFSSIYRIQNIDGYDPLYLLRYGELIASSERKKADINPPFGFNRIITPHNIDSKIIDLLGVKFVLSLSDLKSDKLKKVFQEGKTRIYKNTDVIRRAFFVQNTQSAFNKEESIKLMFANNFNPRETAVLELENTGGGEAIPPERWNKRWSKGKAEIIVYTENKIIVKTNNSEDGFMVLTDSFYPIWHATIDSLKTKIYRTDYNFRGVVVPAGKHKVEFYSSLF